MSRLLSFRLTPIASVLLALLAAWPTTAHAQERRTVTIDYVGVEGVYLAVGSEQGVTAGDTLGVFASLTAPEPLARLVLLSVTRRRSVAEVLGNATSMERGAEILIELPVLAAAIDEEVPAVTAPPGAPPSASADLTARRASVRASSAPRVTGRLALDIDARETRTSWTGDLSGETRRRFATPTTRLSMTASGLPGGFTVRTSVRAAYRYTELDFGLPATTYRTFELSAEKHFDAAPVTLRLGRFHNPYESYSAYWDGVLLRVGKPRGIGLGVVAGFQPERYNEGLSSAMPKVTGFADLRFRGTGWRYDSDLSVHRLRPEDSVNRTFVGWTQRLTIARVTLDQRLRMDRSGESREWAVSQLRLRAGVGLGATVRLRATYNRARRSALLDEALFTAPDREETTLGVAIRGGAASLDVDAGRTLWDDEHGIFVSARTWLSLGSAAFVLSGRRWERLDQASTSVAPGFIVPLGPVDTRLTYRLYETAGTTTLRTHAVDVSLMARFARMYSVTVRGQQQWGENLTGTRLQFGVVRRF